jgi:thymidylate synthase
MLPKLDKSYINLIRHILSTGSWREDRTGVGVISSFCATDFVPISFDLRTESPILSIKKVPWWHAAVEMLWMMKGLNDSSWLESKSINIWKENTSRQFLDKRGLNWLKEGSIGAAYGFQMRNAGGRIKDMSMKGSFDTTARTLGALMQLEQQEQSQSTKNNLIVPATSKDDVRRDIGDAKISGERKRLEGVVDSLCSVQIVETPIDERGGVDQLSVVANELRTNPESRRHIISLWDVVNLPNMALPPCHLLTQFYVEKGGAGSQSVLHAAVTIRSSDVFLGLPFNLVNYATMVTIIAEWCGYIPGRVSFRLGDAHLYRSHMESVDELCSRENSQHWDQEPYVESTKGGNRFPRIELASAEILQRYNKQTGKVGTANEAKSLGDIPFEVFIMGLLPQDLRLCNEDCYSPLPTIKAPLAI